MKRRWMLAGGLVVLALCLVGWAMRTQPSAPKGMTSIVPQGPIDADVFIEQKRFDLARAQAAQKTFTTPDCQKIRGGVVNHHFLATDLLASFFAELKACRPDLDRVIILSPDHYHQSHHIGMTHTRSYLAQGTVIQVDAEAVDRLKHDVPDMDVRDQPFEIEHGIGALLPFLVKEQSNVKIVPVALEETINQKTAGTVATWLADELIRDPKTFVIVSSDMSHYLPLVSAKAHDEKTMQAFKAHDLAFFWQATDDNTDNGKSVWIAMQALGKGVTWRQTAHGVSTDYGGSQQYTTSYINGFWSK